MQLIARIYGPLDVAVQSYWIARHHRFKRELEAVPTDSDVHLLPTGETPSMRYNDVTRSAELMALAYEAGAALKDMEFVQFHPTGMVFPPGVAGLLVTEAVRGEGGILRNRDGVGRFLHSSGNPGALFVECRSGVLREKVDGYHVPVLPDPAVGDCKSRQTRAGRATDACLQALLDAREIRPDRGGRLRAGGLSDGGGHLRSQ